MKNTTTALLLGMLTQLASAHDGHGLTGGHWHATDALVFVAVLVAAVAAFWISGGRK